MAFELSNTKWKICYGIGGKGKYINVDAGNLAALLMGVKKAKESLKLRKEVPVRSCYEAGRDGFWIHRFLLEKKIENVVVDSSSIEVNRHKRRAKNDRLDANKLYEMLVRYHRGEQGVWKVCRIPTVAEEDARRIHRELDRLKEEKTSHLNRIRSLLVLHGFKINPGSPRLIGDLEKIRSWNNTQLPLMIKAEITREFHRLTLVRSHIDELEKLQIERIANPSLSQDFMVIKLQRLKGIGFTSAWVFVYEFFGWRKFDNRKELAGAAGLTPTPYDSGGSSKEQGIDKAGSEKIRSLIVEISWCWLRYQPNSKQSHWFNERFANNGKRMRRIGITAVARRLLIDLWRYLEFDIIPEGAELKN